MLDGQFACHLWVFLSSAKSLGQDVTPHQIINPIIDVSKYFRNHHTPGALLYEFSNQGAMN